MMSKGVKRDSLNTNIVTSNPVFTVLCGGGVMLNARPDRILDLPVGRVVSGCLLDESFSTVLSKNNIIRYSEALAEEGFCIGQTCRPEFIPGPCKPVVLTNPHPTLSLGEGVMCTAKCGPNFTFSKRWRAVA